MNSEEIPTFLVHQSMSAANDADDEAEILYSLVEKLNLVKTDFSQSMKFDHKLLLSGYIHDEKYM